MIDSPAYRETLSRLETGQPKLVPFFIRAVESAAAVAEPDAQAIRALGQLAIVSEHTYINVEAFVSLTLRRGELTASCSLLFELSRLNPVFPTVLLARYPSLTSPLSAFSSDLLELARACAGSIKKGEKALAFSLGLDDPTAARTAMRHLRTAAVAAPGALPEILDRFPTTLATVPGGTFLSWLSRGADLLSSNRVEEGVGFLKGRTRESRAVLGVTSAVLDDMKRVLKIYASSLAGRDLSVLDLEQSSLGETSPYTDGRTMFLPSEIRWFESTERNESIYTLLAAQQAAAIGMGTFGLDLSRIDFADELRDRYFLNLPPIMANVRKQYGRASRSIRERSDGSIEVHLLSGRTIRVMETEHERFYYQFPAPVLARALFSLAENARVQRALSAKYPGLAQDFSSFDAFLWRQRPLLPDPGGDTDARLTAVLECLVQYSLQKKWKVALRDEDLRQRVEQVISAFEDGVAAAACVEDSARVCFNLYKLLDVFTLIPWSDRHDAREFFSRSGKQEILPEIVHDVSPEIMKIAVVRAERRQQGEAGVPQEIDITTRTVQDAAARHVREALASGDLRVFRYPEFDITAGAYRKGHCTLYERALETRQEDAYHSFLALNRTTYTRTMKRFLSVRPEGVELSRRWLSGDEIHLGDAVDYMIELLRGASPEETIYFRKVTNRRDIVAAVVVDASSSTDAEVAGRRIIDVEKAALSILASALSKIRDDFGVFTYFSLGRHRVFFEIVKDFNEPWDERTQGRIGSIHPQAANRDGCVIRHAAARLAEQPHATKLLLLLSDGVPADLDYGSESSAEASPYGLEDTRRAILECKRMGIVPYCITIDRTARDYIAHLYGDFHYTVIDDVAQLPERLSRFYLRFTG